MKRAPSLLLFLALPWLVIGCQDATAPTPIALLLQVRVETTPPPLMARTVAKSPAPAPGVESIDLDEIFVAFGGLELNRSIINGKTDFLLDQPVVVPLRLSGAATLVLSTPVPPDEYRSIEVFVDKLDPGTPTDAPLIEVFPDLEGSSVLLRGTLVRDGVEETFVFTAPLAAREEYTFPAPRRFSASFRSAALYTFVMKMDEWFRADFGELLDPNDPEDQAAIEANMIGSMELIQGS